MKPLLSVKNLTLYFKENQEKFYALENLSFDLFPKETLAIVGESGSGKSVLVKAIMGLHTKENAHTENGEIIYQGVNLAQLSEKEIRPYRGKEIAMIFQDPSSSLNPTMRVGHQVAESYLLHHKGASKKRAYEKVLELFTLSGISSPENRFFLYPHELSGGMKQRVMIASALAQEPKILIADEPTTALDVTIQAQILDLLQDIQKNLGMSIIFITHDLSLASAFASHILVMYGGGIVESASTKELFQNPSHPYTKKLLDSVPKISLGKSESLTPIQGSPPSPFETFKGCKFFPRCPNAIPLCGEKAPPLVTLPSGSKSACWHVPQEVAHE